MRIGLIVTGLKRLDARRATSDHASTRLRALIPANGLVRRGHALMIFSDRDALDGRVDEYLPCLDVLVVHKARLDLSAVLTRARATGVAVVVDLCDHVFLNRSGLDFYPAMLERASLVTAPTRAMAEVAAAHVGGSVRVIADAVEGRRDDPGPATVAEPTRFLWFGRSQNAGPLEAALPGLSPFAPASLEVVTDPRSGLAERLAEATPAGVTTTVTPWTTQSVEAALRRCDLVLVPGNEDPVFRVKSANRLERALWGGRMVAATAVPAAREWGDVVYLGNNLGAAIAAALAGRSAWPERIRRAQDRIARLRSAAVLAEAWEGAVLEAIGAASPLGRQTPPV